MNLLMLHKDAAHIKEVLGSKFPDVSIHAAADERDIGDLIAETETTAKTDG